MKFVKVYGIKNNEKSLIFGSIEVNALVNEGVKTAEKQGYIITDIIALPQARNKFIESPFTERAKRLLLQRVIR